VFETRTGTAPATRATATVELLPALFDVNNAESALSWTDGGQPHAVAIDAMPDAVAPLLHFKEGVRITVTVQQCAASEGVAAALTAAAGITATAKGELTEGVKVVGTWKRTEDRAGIVMTVAKDRAKPTVAPTVQRVLRSVQLQRSEDAALAGGGGATYLFGVEVVDEKQAATLRLSLIVPQ
jgi:hypothetical protein